MEEGTLAGLILAMRRMWATVLGREEEFPHLRRVQCRQNHIIHAGGPAVVRVACVRADAGPDYGKEEHATPPVSATCFLPPSENSQVSLEVMG